MILTLEARAHPRNIETYRRILRIEEHLISDSYRDREDEHRDLTRRCRSFFRRKDTPSLFAFREYGG